MADRPESVGSFGREADRSRPFAPSEGSDQNAVWNNRAAVCSTAVAQREAGGQALSWTGEAEQDDTN